MKTNLDKWNYYKAIIDSRENDFVQKEAINVPTHLYSVNPNGSIVEKTVTHTSYYNGKHLSFNKIPTKKNVELIKQMAESLEPLVKERIHIHYKYSNSSSAVKYTELHTFLSKDDAEIKSNEIKAKIAAENELLANGHRRCERCRVVVPDSQIIESKIISYATYGRAGRVGKFCSGTCAGEEQMAHEG